MSTLTQLTDEVLLNLESYGMLQPKLIATASAVDADDTVLTLTTTNGVVAGVMGQLEDELVYITDLNTASKQVTLIRGYRSTPAASHASGVSFEVNPLWPRWAVSRAINKAITSAYPRLFGTGEAVISSHDLNVAYPLDPVVDAVYAVKTLNPVTQEWVKIRNWRFDKQLQTLFIAEWIIDQGNVHVTYFKKLSPIASTDDITASGLQLTSEAYVVAQASMYLVAGMANQRLQVNYASADDMDVNRTIGDVGSVTRILAQLASIELEAERKRLVATYPAQINIARGRAF